MAEVEVEAAMEEGVKVEAEMEEEVKVVEMGAVVKLSLIHI